MKPIKAANNVKGPVRQRAAMAMGMPIPQEKVTPGITKKIKYPNGKKS